MHITTNKRALYDYEILEKYEAGLVLFGHEVKSIKTGHINLAGAYVTLKDSELYLINAHIPPFQSKNVSIDYNPYRSRKLLLHKSEIKSLIGKIKQKGLTLVPLSVYIKRGKIKLGFGIGKGKKQIDKRESIKKREAEKKIERAMKGNI